MVMKLLTGFMVALFVLSLVGIVCGQAVKQENVKPPTVKSEDLKAVITGGTVTKVEEDKRTSLVGFIVTFKTEKGDEVISRLSNSRTRVMVGDSQRLCFKEGKISDPKIGDKIEITYLPFVDRNEAILIKIIR